MSTENKPSKQSAPLINLNLSFDAELRYKNKNDKLEPAKPVPVVHNLPKNDVIHKMGKTQSNPNKNTPDFVLPDLPPIRLDHHPAGHVIPQNPSFRPMIPKTKKQLPVKIRNNDFQQPVNLAQLQRRYQNSSQPEKEKFDALHQSDTEGRTLAHLLEKWNGTCTLEELFGMLAKKEVLEAVISDERTRMELEKKGIQEKLVKMNEQHSVDEKNTSVKMDQSVKVNPSIKVNAKSLKSQQAKRPLNSYMLFAKLNRHKFKEKWPAKDNKTITSDLGVAWKALGLEEKHKCKWIVAYEELAEEIKMMHGKYFPDYQYDPKRKKKEELKRTLDSPNLPIKTKMPKVRQENSYRTSKKLKLF